MIYIPQIRGDYIAFSPQGIRVLPCGHPERIWLAAIVWDSYNVLRLPEGGGLLALKFNRSSTSVDHKSVIEARYPPLRQTDIGNCSSVLR